MTKCEALLQAEIAEFNIDDSDTWSPSKPTLAEYMGQLKYNACSDAYEDKSITKAEVIAAFGQDLYDEIDIVKYEYDNDI
jgi:hypothetical protein